MGDRWEQLKRDWDRGTDVLTKKDPDYIWNPLRQEWVKVDRGDDPAPEAFDRLSTNDPNDVEDRLEHVEMLFRRGLIGQEEAEAARRHILEGV